MRGVRGEEGKTGVQEVREGQAELRDLSAEERQHSEVRRVRGEELLCVEAGRRELTSMPAVSSVRWSAEGGTGDRRRERCADPDRAERAEEGVCGAVRELPRTADGRQEWDRESDRERRGQSLCLQGVSSRQTVRSAGVRGEEVHAVQEQ